MSVASQITRKAKSNLAFALKILSTDRRQEMVTFYAFCRTIDDLADDPAIPLGEREKSLNAWESGLSHGFSAPDAFQKEVLDLCARQEIPNDLLLAIIDGCRSDLQPQRFQTQQELSTYIWKVACAVGLVSIKIFGCKDPASEKYAVALGQALQLTNILRDIGEDLANDRRIYLPLDDLARFGYTEQDLLAHIHDGRFHALMAYEADRAEAYFNEAARILPPADRQALLPARMMAQVYQLLLHRMRADQFRVFEKRYRLSRARKLMILTKHLIARSL